VEKSLITERMREKFFGNSSQQQKNRNKSSRKKSILSSFPFSGKESDLIHLPNELLRNSTIGFENSTKSVKIGPDT